MTKYIEELNNGDSFTIDSIIYILTTDFKRSGERSAVSTKDGRCRWFGPSQIVNTCQLYSMDKDNNIIPIKISEKPNAFNQT